MFHATARHRRRRTGTTAGGQCITTTRGGAVVYVSTIPPPSIYPPLKTKPDHHPFKTMPPWRARGGLTVTRTADEDGVAPVNRPYRARRIGWITMHMAAAFIDRQNVINTKVLKSSLTLGYSCYFLKKKINKIMRNVNEKKIALGTIESEEDEARKNKNTTREKNVITMARRTQNCWREG